MQRTCKLTTGEVWKALEQILRALCKGDCFPVIHRNSGIFVSVNDGILVLLN